MKPPRHKSLRDSAEELARAQPLYDPPFYDFNRNGTPRAIHMKKTHPRSLPAQKPTKSPISEQTWSQLREMERRAKRIHLWKIVAALALFAVLGFLYMRSR